MSNALDQPDDAVLVDVAPDGTKTVLPAVNHMWGYPDGTMRLVIGYAEMGDKPLVLWLDPTWRQHASPLREFWVDGARHLGKRFGGMTPIPHHVMQWVSEHDYTLVKMDEARPRCPDCGERVDFSDHYMLIEEVWLSIASKMEVLHLWCAAKRLFERHGRELQPADFTDAPLNKLLQLGFAIGSEFRRVQSGEAP